MTRQKQEDKLLELVKLVREIALDIAPGADSVGVYAKASGYISVSTNDQRIDMTQMDDGRVIYTAEWDKYMGRTRKEKNDDTLRADHGV